MSGIETLVGTAFLGVFGNPFILGVFFLIIVIAAIAVMRIGLEGGVIVMIPAFFLLFETLSGFETLKIIVAIAMGFMVMFAILRILHR